MNHYWELTLRDGTKVQIPPEGVEVVQRRWDQGRPISTRRQVIPPNQIVSFEQTSRVKTDVPLIEAAAQAFKEPMEEEVNGEIVIQARWVKKQVTQREWEKFYSASGYKRLPDEGGMVVVAFRLPTHQIDSKVSYCSDSDIKVLTNK